MALPEWIGRRKVAVAPTLDLLDCLACLVRRYQVDRRLPHKQAHLA